LSLRPKYRTRREARPASRSSSWRSATADGRCGRTPNGRGLIAVIRSWPTGGRGARSTRASPTTGGLRTTTARTSRRSRKPDRRRPMAKRGAKGSGGAGRKRAGGAPPANGSAPGDNSKNRALTFDEERALFLQHKSAIDAIEAQKAAVQTKLDEAYGAAKIDG